MKKIVIIPSGGTGSRTGLTIPKQYIKVCDKEIIAHTIQVFQNSLYIDEIIIAAQNQFHNTIDEIKHTYNFSKISKLVESGNTRQDSVYNALISLPNDHNQIVIVHDAVRPLLSNTVLEDAINFATEFGAVVVGIKARDTLLNGVDYVEKYIDRSNIYYAQTPQIFKYEILMDSMKLAYKTNFSATDESMIVKNAGYNVKIVDGSSLNFKITSADDIKLFQKICEDTKS